MRLSERLRQVELEAAIAGGDGDGDENDGASRESAHDIDEPVAAVAERPGPLAALIERRPTADPQGDLKRRIGDALHGRLGARLYDAASTDDQLRDLVAAELDELLALEPIPLTVDERTRLHTEVVDDVLGYGPIEPFLADDLVSEVMVNGTAPIYVERAGRLQRTDAHFREDAHLRRVIERIVGAVGRRIDESSPMVDARLPDGSRINAVIPPLAVDGPCLTVRKFAKEHWGVEELTAFGTFTPQIAGFLSECVRGRLNVLVSGGTGTGKTTLLNALSSFIPDDERIVTIEDAVELRLQQDHVVRLESRPANLEGRGRIDIRDLVRNALRMRPDRIIVGEVRGGEALDMLQAMNTGHDGSLCTVHANTPRDALSRLETMVLMAGMDLPSRAVREQVASSLDLVVHIARLRDGSRRVTQVSEVVGMEGQVITLQDIFTFDHSAGVDGSGRVLGTARPTGIRPVVVQRLAERGVELPVELFWPGDVAEETR